MSEKIVKDSRKKKSLIKVKMIRSALSATRVQRACVVGLGLRKIGQIRELEDSSAVRGMVKKVDHLVSIV